MSLKFHEIVYTDKQTGKEKVVGPVAGLSKRDRDAFTKKTHLQDLFTVKVRESRGPWSYKTLPGGEFSNRYAITFKGKIQPFGETFFHERGDVKKFVLKAITALNEAYAHNQAWVTIERPGRDSIDVKVSNKKGLIV